MYGDALISAAIIMFILPVVLSIFWMATLTVYRAYYWDHILQDTITYLEVAKASYYKNEAIETGVYNSQFTMSPSEKITYKIHKACSDRRCIFTTINSRCHRQSICCLFSIS